MTKLLMGKDVNGMPSTPFVEIPFSNMTFIAELVTNVPFVVTVPANTNVVYFSFTKAINVLVTLGSGPIPGGTGLLLLEDGSDLLLEDGDKLLLEGSSGFLMGGGSDLNPWARTVEAGDTLTLLSDANGMAVLNFYNREHLGTV